MFETSGSLVFPQPESRINLIISPASIDDQTGMKIEKLKTSSSLPEVLISEICSDEGVAFAHAAGWFL